MARSELALAATQSGWIPLIVHDCGPVTSQAPCSTIVNPVPGSTEKFPAFAANQSRTSSVNSRARDETVSVHVEAGPPARTVPPSHSKESIRT